MRPEISVLSSTTDLSEDDLQNVLRERDGCKLIGDEAGYAECLLILGHVVKWVRSDNQEDPFTRSRTLAVEALAIARRVNEPRLLARALRAAATLAPPQESTAMLEEAMGLAKQFGDELEEARTLARQARLAPKGETVPVMRQALALFEKVGNKGGQANCYFSLIIYLEGPDQRLDAAMKATALFEEVNDFGQASKALQLGLSFGKIKDPNQRLELALRGLTIAQKCGDHFGEGQFYRALAVANMELGNAEESAKYQRWAQDIEDSDGLTPKEREKQNKAFAKVLSKIAKSVGANDAAKMFLDQAK